MQTRPLLLCTLALLLTLPLAAQTFSVHSYPGHGGNLLTADFNRDGHTDLLEYGGFNTPAFIAINDGHGGFPTATPLGTAINVNGAAIADFNKDGYPDVAACVDTSPSEIGPLTFAINVYLNQSGSGTFSLKQSIPLPSNMVCTSMSTGDMNNDGNTDLVVGVTPLSGGGQSFLYTFFDSATGTLAAPVQQAVTLTSQDPNFTCFLNGLAAADFTGTGRYDVLIYGLCTSDVPGSLTLNYAQNTGGGHYAVTRTFEQGPVGFDLINPLRLVNANNDLLPDLVIVNDGFDHPGSNFHTLIATSQGGGKFGVQDVIQEFDSDGSCLNRISAADIADLNGDKNPDVINSATVPTTGCGAGLRPGYILQAGNGNGSFPITQQVDLPDASPSSENFDVVAADFNNDNRQDFAVLATNTRGAIELHVYTNISSFAVSPCLAGGPGAHLCVPAAVSSTSEKITATATGVTGPVRLVQLYIDGKKVNQFAGNQVNTVVTVTPGTHNAQVAALEYNGQLSKSAIATFTTSSTSTCAAPATAGVKICTPASGATVTSPVAIKAAARAATGTTITAMRVYVDSVAKTTVTGATISTSVAMAAGKHTLSVVGFEANGAALKSTEIITVP